MVNSLAIVNALPNGARTHALLDDKNAENRLSLREMQVYVTSSVQGGELAATNISETRYAFHDSYISGLSLATSLQSSWYDMRFLVVVRRPQNRAAKSP